MPTRIGTGAAAHPHASSAVTSAVQLAMRGLGSQTPTYGFLFASPDLDLRGALATARELSACLDIIGCTTAGEITEQGLIHGGVSVMFVASDATTHIRLARGLAADRSTAAQRLSEGLQERKRAAAGRDQRHLTAVLLTDGLAGTGEALVNDLYEARVQNGTQIVGGAAGDEGRFKRTLVGTSEEACADAATVMYIFGERAWGVGVDHGLRPTTKQARVTRSEGNVVFEIDGRPAFAFYEKHAADRGVPLTRENAGPYMIANELGIHFFEKIGRARAPLRVGADGSLACAGDIPKGSMVSILDGDPDSMVRAARSAAEEAHATLGSATAAGVLLFDCVCRGMILKDQFHREVEAVRSVFPGVPIAGFLTYGEIARGHGKLDGWHNTTAVVAAIPA